MRAALFLLFFVCILFAMGLLMVFNTTSAEVLDRSLQISTHQALFRQIVYGILGAIIGCGFFFLGYQQFLRLTPFFLFLSMVFLILVFIPKIGQTLNGAHRWVGFFGYTLQPSEFAKYILPSYFIYRIEEKGAPQSFREFLQRLVIFLPPLALILIEPDNGTTAIILLTFVVLFFLIKIPLSYWAVPLMSVVLVGSVVAYHMPHVPDRIRIYLHPELDLRGKGHQPYQAKIAAGSGRLLGKGLGESLQKLDYLPEARSDYIAAIYAEEFGFVGILALISVYMAIAYLGFSIAFRARDKNGFYLATMLTFLITFQAFLNLGVVSGLLPSKGITLPFFSQGGSSLIVNSIALALLLQIAKESKQKIKV